MMKNMNIGTIRNMSREEMQKMNNQMMKNIARYTTINVNSHAFVTILL